MKAIYECLREGISRVVQGKMRYGEFFGALCGIFPGS